MTTVTSAAPQCVASISATFGQVFEQIGSWRGSLETFIASAAGAVTSTAIDELTETLVVPGLSRDRALIIGAGFVASPGFLVDTEWHLAWWLGQSNTFGTGSASPALRRLEAEEDPSSESFRDYTTLEWWRVPSATGARHITGPYVDYLCTDEYTLTLTMPVVHNAAMVGVVGADLYVNDVERALLPAVRAIGGPVTLINASGRVVVSTDPHRPTGSILRTDAAGETIPVGDTSLLLILG